MTYFFREPERDPDLRAALRQLELEEQPEGADALQQRIVRAAAPRLARLRGSGQSWWEWISSWNRVALPLGAAAAVIAGVLIYESGSPTVLAPSAEVSSDSTLVLSALGGSNDQLTTAVVAPAERDWLLEQAATR